MTPTDFRQTRYFLDLSIVEAAQALRIGRSTVIAYESGRRSIPGAVARQLREMRDLCLAAHSERDMRRSVEDRFEGWLPRLYLGETPDGWLSIVESLLNDVDQRLPAICRDGRAFAMDFKEKWGDLAIGWFIDHIDNPEVTSFSRWLQKRIKGAAAEAERTCARCGANGKEAGVSFTTSGWVLPLCRRHAIMREGRL